jgi:hypothetical protein
MMALWNSTEPSEGSNDNRMILFCLSGSISTFCAQPHIERVQYTDCAPQRDDEVFGALVARDLRLVNAEPLGQIALRDSLGDAEL